MKTEICSIPQEVIDYFRFHLGIQGNIKKNIHFKLNLRKELMVSEANNRDHWRIKNKRKKTINQYLNKAFNQLSYQPRFPIPCKVTLTRISPRKLDYDNNVFNFKGVRDHIADFLIPGHKPGRADSENNLDIEWIYLQRKGLPKEYAIEIFIEAKES